MSQPKHNGKPDAGAAGGNQRALRAFLMVWSPSLLLVVATGLCVFAVSWWISRDHDGGAKLGVVVGAASAVSLLSVIAFSGAVDRSDRRVTLIRLLLGLVVPVGCLVLILGTAPGGLLIAVAGACYVLVITVEALYMATMETVGADLAPAGWPASRTALLTQLHPQVERIIAPAVAGGLVAAGALRLIPVVALAVMALVLVAVLAARRHIDCVTTRVALAARQVGVDGGDAAGRLRTALRDAMASVRLIRSHRELRFLVWLGVLANMVVFPFYAILPAFLTEYSLPARDQALLYGRAATAYGIGMFVGTLLLLPYRQRVGTRRALMLASAAFAVISLMLVAVTVVSWPAFLVVAMAFNGALFAVLVAVGGGVWLRRTPAAIRVRVFSLRRLIVFSSIPLGTTLIGIGGAAVGYRSFVRVMAFVVIAGLVVAWLRHGRRLPRDDVLLSSS